MDINLVNIVNQFQIIGKPISIEPYGNGHINRTYLLITDKKHYILQKINNYVFKDVDLLMNNIFVVTEYIRSIGQESMVIVKTNKNELYYKENDNSYWRIYEFVMNTICYEGVDNINLVEKDGIAFGKLHKDLDHLDASKLKEVIKDFHNTPKRYLNFLEAVNLDLKDRKKNCLKEIEMFEAHKDELSYIVDGIKEGKCNLRTTHNDPKINNVLFDAKTGEVRCIIDLDTVMPGSPLYDVGDAFRSLFSGPNEDSKDLSLLRVNFEVFEKYIKGYASQMKGVLTAREVELLPYSAFLLTIECGYRFLEDYLRGDVYFHTKYDDHNLIRARTQITLANDIYNNFDKLKAIVKKYF